MNQWKKNPQTENEHKHYQSCKIAPALCQQWVLQGQDTSLQLVQALAHSRCSTDTVDTQGKNPHFPEEETEVQKG